MEKPAPRVVGRDDEAAALAVVLTGDDGFSAVGRQHGRASALAAGQDAALEHAQRGVLVEPVRHTGKRRMALAVGRVSRSDRNRFTAQGLDAGFMFYFLGDVRLVPYE